VRFAGGIYALPILTAPPAPRAGEVGAVAAKASFTGQFRRDLDDSDAQHWGEGTASVGRDAVALMGRVAPGQERRRSGFLASPGTQWLIIQGLLPGNAFAPSAAVAVALRFPGVQQPQPVGCLNRA
jgi:hypothetical protein